METSSYAQYMKVYANRRVGEGALPGATSAGRPPTAAFGITTTRELGCGRMDHPRNLYKECMSEIFLHFFVGIFPTYILCRNMCRKYSYKEIFPNSEQIPKQSLTGPIHFRNISVLLPCEIVKARLADTTLQSVRVLATPESTERYPTAKNTRHHPHAFRLRETQSRRRDGMYSRSGEIQPLGIVK